MGEGVRLPAGVIWLGVRVDRLLGFLRSFLPFFLLFVLPFFLIISSSPLVSAFRHPSLLLSAEVEESGHGAGGGAGRGANSHWSGRWEGLRDTALGHKVQAEILFKRPSFLHLFTPFHY